MCYTEDSLRGAADTNFGYVYVLRVYLAYHFFKKNIFESQLLKSEIIIHYLQRIECKTSQYSIRYVDRAFPQVT